MEYPEKYHEKYRNTPDTRSKRFIRFIRFGRSELRRIFTFKYGGEILRYVFISSICDDCFEVAAEGGVVESLLTLRPWEEYLYAF